MDWESILPGLLNAQPGAGAVATPAPVAPVSSNLAAADKEMQLTPQERALYQRHLTNLTGPGGVDNPDGSRSTLYQMSVGLGDRVFNLPTVYDGKILQPDEAIARARKQGLDNFPSYKSNDEAEARYQRMHDFMERDTGDYLKTRKPAPFGSLAPGYMGAQ